MTDQQLLKVWASALKKVLPQRHVAYVRELNKICDKYLSDAEKHTLQVAGFTEFLNDAIDTNPNISQYLNEVSATADKYKQATCICETQTLVARGCVCGGV